MATPLDFIPVSTRTRSHVFRRQRAPPRASRYDFIESDDDSDTDYSPGEDEQEDDIHNQLAGPAEAAEEFLARHYGWQVGATSETQGLVTNGQVDRDYYLEAPGHAAVAAMHDIGIPAESSLANSENRVGEIEARSLERGFEPWELEAAHATTGRDHRELAALFNFGHNGSRPPRRSFWTAFEPQIDDPLPLPSRPVPVIDRLLMSNSRLAARLCSRCHRMQTEEFVQWATTSRDAVVCLHCRFFRRPAVGVEDPDWVNVNAGVYDPTEICLCRCDCDLEALEAASREQDLFADEIEGEDTEMDEADDEDDEDSNDDDSEDDDRPAAVRFPPLTRRSSHGRGSGWSTSSSSSSSSSASTSSSSSSSSSEDGTASDASGPANTIPDIRPATLIREYVGLPSLALEDPSAPTPLLDTIRGVLSTAHTLHRAGHYADAMRYAEVGLHMSYSAPIGEGNALSQSLTDLITHLFGHLNADENFPDVDVESLTLANLMDTVDEVMEHAGYDAINRATFRTLLEGYFGQNLR